MKPSGYNTQKLAAEAAAMEVRLPCTVTVPALQLGSTYAATETIR